MGGIRREKKSFTMRFSGPISRMAKTSPWWTSLRPWPSLWDFRPGKPGTWSCREDYGQAVDADWERSRALGINAVPTFSESESSERL